MFTLNRSRREHRLSQRRAQSAALSGSGPCPDEAPPAAHPGGVGKFALFAEVMWAGVLIVVLSLPILTLPAALVAGIGHLRRFLAAEPSGIGAVLRDFRASVVGGLGVAVVALAGAAASILTMGLARADDTQIGTLMIVVSVAAVVIIVAALVMSAAAWTREGGWLRSARGLRSQLDADLGGAGYVVVALLCAALLAWQQFILVLPGLGLVAFCAAARLRAPATNQH
ncbi:MAG: hypothetical protein ACK5KO_10825 [Arachnia sp.]